MAAQKPKYKGAKFSTPTGRASWPNVFTPKLKYQTKTNEMEYTIDVLFDTNTDLTKFRAACDTALTEVFGADKKKWPQNISMPLIDQQVLIDDAESKGKPSDHYIPGAFYAKFKTNAKNGKPIVVDSDSNLTEITDPNKIYGGCFVRVSGQLKVNIIDGKDPVTKKPTRAIYLTPYLGGVQFIKDGDPFGGRLSASEMFEPVAFDAGDDLVG